MPRLINAYSAEQGGIADALKDIGQSIWGDAAKNEQYRQHARRESLEADKIARESAANEEFARSLRDNDPTSMYYHGARAGLQGGNVNNYSMGRAAVAAGPNYDDPTLATRMLGAGHQMSSTAPGQGRALQAANERIGVVGEDPMTGTKIYGPRGGAPMGVPGAPVSGGLYQQAPGLTPATGGRITTIGNTEDDLSGPEETDPTRMTGEQLAGWLAKNNPALLSQATGLLDGRVAPPRTGTLSAKGQTLMAIASRLDPGFDMTKWTGRYRTMQSFSGNGPDALAVKSANQGMGHLLALAQEADALHNHENIGKGIPVIGGLVGMGTQALNASKNAQANASGEVGTGPFDLSRHGPARPASLRADDDRRDRRGRAGRHRSRNGVPAPASHAQVPADHPGGDRSNRKSPRRRPALVSVSGQEQGRGSGHPGEAQGAGGRGRRGQGEAGGKEAMRTTSKIVAAIALRILHADLIGSSDVDDIVTTARAEHGHTIAMAAFNE
jgi:hypothetical protein